MEQSDELYYQKLQKFYPDVDRVNQLSLFDSWFEIYSNLTSQLFDCESLSAPRLIPDVYVQSISASKNLAGVVETNGRTTLYRNLGQTAKKGGQKHLAEASKLELDAKNIHTIVCGSGRVSYLTTEGDLFIAEIPDGLFKEPTTLIQTDPLGRSSGPAPEFIRLGQQVRKVVLGLDHLMFITGDNELYGQGDNQYSQLGFVEPVMPTPKLIVGQVEDVACGYYHTIFLQLSNGVFGMGDNQFGQLGLGKILTQQSYRVLMSHVESIAAGYNNTGLISTDKILYVSGDNHEGQLGFNSGAHPIIVEFEEMATQVKTVTFSPKATLFIDLNSTVYFCGRDKKRSISKPMKILDHIHQVSFGSETLRLCVGYNPSKLGLQLERMMKTPLIITITDDLQVPSKIIREIEKQGLTEDIFDQYSDVILQLIQRLSEDYVLTADDIEFLVRHFLIDIDLIYSFFRVEGEPVNALQLAVKMGDIERIQRMLKLGADPNLLDLDGYSALDNLFDQGLDGAVVEDGLALLLQYQARPEIRRDIYDKHYTEYKKWAEIKKFLKMAEIRSA